MNFISEIQKKRARFAEIETLLSTPEVISDNQKSRALNQEYSELRDLLHAVDDGQHARQ